MPAVTFHPGRQPEDRSKPRLRLTPHVRSAVAPPESADYYTHVQAWGVLGNAEWGDCIFAGNGHIVEQQTAEGEGSEVGVSEADALAEYSSVTGFNPDAGPSGSNPTDNGGQIQDGLADLRKNGLAGQKIAAYARVNEADETEMKTALSEFGCVDLGVNLPQSAMDQFNDGKPWTVLPDDGGILGGHCVVAFGYDADYVYIVTWGKVVAVAWSWIRTYCEEAWAVISAMWAGKNGDDPEGVDQDTLGAEFAELTGDPSPWAAPVPAPSPAPAPAPTPGPSPQPSPDELLDELARLLRDEIDGDEADLRRVLAWLDSHGL